MCMSRACDGNYLKIVTGHTFLKTIFIRTYPYPFLTTNRYKGECLDYVNLPFIAVFQAQYMTRVYESAAIAT
jgi:hypothetical protein